MQILQERIRRDGKVLGKGILKVDSFMNHQIDSVLMKSIGEEFARRFAKVRPTRILTAETSGIAPALSTGMAMNLPIIFARKHQPVTMAEGAFRQTAESHTFGKPVELIVSAEYLLPEDRILILDDFLSTARTISALVKVVESSGATLVGVGAVIEKVFEGGRQVLSHLTVPIETLAAIERFDNETVVFTERFQMA